MSAARALLRALPKHAALRRAAAGSALVAPRARAALPTISSSVSSLRHGSTIPPRNESFAKVTPDTVKDLRGLLGSQTSLISTIDGTATADDLVTYNDDWMNKYHGKGKVVIKPKTTEEVAAVVKYCYEHNIAMVPQGGNTGLVGGCRMRWWWQVKVVVVCSRSHYP